MVIQVVYAQENVIFHSFEYSHTYSANILEKSDIEFIFISQPA